MKTIRNSREGTASEQKPYLYAVNGGNQSPTPNPTHPKKRKVPKYLKIFLSALGLYLVALFVMGSYQLWQLQKQVEALEAEQESLQQQQQTLTEEMGALSSPEIIERIARESLRMVKPGETMIIPAAKQ